MSMILQTVLAFVATISFSIIFHVPRSELAFCGCSGAVSWFAYLLTMHCGGSPVLATFAGALCMTYFSRTMTFRRRMPITVYLIAGAIPLVPGAGIYSTMYHIITDDNITAAYTGIETLKIAGVIAIGIIVILSLPVRLFPLRYRLRSR